ncbi:MAG: hypothetical protein HY270_15645 [Deltaproteobacteria bacterium]|nr:hypothetical protein [Deltaproteobacteria bacterium]
MDEVDFSTFWRDLEAKLPARKQPASSRLWALWRDRGSGLQWGWPALVAAAAAAIFALFVFTRSQPSVSAPDSSQVASVESPVSIDSLDADGSVAVVTDLETRTTVLWVSDENAVEEVP